MPFFVFFGGGTIMEGHPGRQGRGAPVQGGLAGVPYGRPRPDVLRDEWRKALLE